VSDMEFLDLRAVPHIGRTMAKGQAGQLACSHIREHETLLLKTHWICIMVSV
jgi:hypothetical protein